jgi:hypothetical protein
LCQLHSKLHSHNFLKNITLKEAWTEIKLHVSHFCIFGSETWAHILDEKRKALQPKSEKCIFVGYSKDVKGYGLFQPHSNEIIIRRDVMFGENLPACEPNSTFVPSFLSNSYVSDPILASSLDDDNADGNPP